jgi:hypothetical protein
MTTPHKLKSSLLTSSDFCLSSAFCRILSHLYSVLFCLLSRSLMLQPTVSRPVFLGKSTHLRLTTRFILHSDSCGFVEVGRFLWREDGSVVYSSCWRSPAQSSWGLSPVGIATIFHCLRLETFLFVISYDSHGYGVGIRPSLHTGFLSSVVFSPWSTFWSKLIEITSFNRRVLTALAVTMLWLVRCPVNSLYLSVVTEMFPFALPKKCVYRVVA